MPRSGSLLEWPLVGRASELEQIARARRAGAAGVAVLGAAGVGKSRLAREALVEFERSGAITIWVQATRSAATVPLGAFASVIPAEVRSDDSFELMRGSVEALSARAGARELVLGVDDAQLLDQTSAALVLQLAGTAAAFVVATIRSGEPCPDAIVSLWKDAGAPRLELGGLAEREAEQLVETIIGGPADHATHRWIWENSQGSPLYIRELVLGALSGGALENVSGLWRMPFRPAVSASLAELITARMTGSSDGERRTLELLALGEPLRISEVTQLVESEPLEALESRGLVSIDGASQDADVRLAHPLYGETIRATLGTIRAREVRLRLAATVRARGDLGPADTLRVTCWLLDAGEEAPTTMLVAAARAANLAGDPDLGADFAQRARSQGGGIEAATLLARAHVIRRRFEDAERVLGEIEGQVPTEEEAIAYLEQRIACLYWGLRRPTDLRALLSRAETWWSDAAWQRRLEPLRLHVLALTEGFGTTVEASAATLADPTTVGELRRQMEPLHVGNLFFSGRTEEALELARRIRPRIPLRSMRDELALGLWSLISLEAGYAWEEYDRYMSSALIEAVKLDDHGGAGLAAQALGCIRLLDGRLADAKRLLVEAELQQEHQDTIGALFNTRALQACLAAAAGDPDAANERLRRCREALAGKELLPSQIPYLARAEGWTARAEGNSDRAQQLFLSAAHQLAAVPVFAAQLDYEALLAGADPKQSAAELRRLRSRTDAPLVAAYAAHAAARAARDGAALMTASGEFVNIGAIRYATEAAADAARAFMNAARQDSARRAAARAHELFALGQGGSPPVIDGLKMPAIGLTPREQQLVALASSGMSNSQIAERLVLSVRTVESHLYRAMQKLGVSDRRQL